MVVRPPNTTKLWLNSKARNETKPVWVQSPLDSKCPTFVLKLFSYAKQKQTQKNKNLHGGGSGIKNRITEHNHFPSLKNSMNQESGDPYSWL